MAGWLSGKALVCKTRFHGFKSRPCLIIKLNTMTKEQQLQTFDTLVAKMREIIASKGDDYANKDRLSNFKNVGRRTNTTPEMVCVNQIGIKVERLSNLLNENKTPNNESIEDTILDGAVYFILLHMIYKERKIEKENPVEVFLKNAKIKKEVLTNPVLQFEVARGMSDGRLNEKVGREILKHSLGVADVEIRSNKKHLNTIPRPCLDIIEGKAIFYI